MNKLSTQKGNDPLFPGDLSLVRGKGLFRALNRTTRGRSALTRHVCTCSRSLAAAPGGWGLGVGFHSAHHVLQEVEVPEAELAPAHAALMETLDRAYELILADLQTLDKAMVIIEANLKLFDEFKLLADKKKDIYDADIAAHSRQAAPGRSTVSWGGWLPGGLLVAVMSALLVRLFTGWIFALPLLIAAVDRSS